MNVLDFAKDGNADQLFAMLEDSDNKNLLKIAMQYELGIIEDRAFCLLVVQYFEDPKQYIVITCIREDWDCPNFDIVDAVDEDEAYDKAAKAGGFEEGELERGEEGGEITIIIKEIK